MDVQLDYDAHFLHCMNKLSGFLKTRFDEGTAQAFRIARGKTGFIELRWQPRASLVEPWLGVNGMPEADGFVLQKWTPIGAPAVVQAKPVMTEKSIKQMLSFKMRDILRAQHCEAAFEWIGNVARDAAVPLVAERQHRRLAGSMGRLCDIGAAEKIVTIQVIDEQALEAELAEDGKTFWACPKLSKEAMAARAAKIEAAVAKYNRIALANVRYKHDKADLPDLPADQRILVDDRVMTRLTEENKKLRARLTAAHGKLREQKAGEGGGVVHQQAGAQKKGKKKKKKKRVQIVDDSGSDDDEWLPAGEARPKAREVAAAPAPPAAIVVEEEGAAEVDGDVESEAPAVVAGGEERGAYLVEKILQHRHSSNGDAGEYEYKVLWKGWPRESATWEPASSFDSPVWVKEYHEAVERKRAARRKLEEDSRSRAPPTPKGAKFPSLEAQFQASLTNLPAKRLRGGGASSSSSSSSSTAGSSSSSSSSVEMPAADHDDDNKEEKEEDIGEEETPPPHASPGPPPLARSAPAAPPLIAAGPSSLPLLPGEKKREKKRVAAGDPAMNAGLAAQQRARKKARR
jgi:hypothetical protein